jgi:hypothetical protein
MHPTVYRVLTVLCALVAGVPLGTNLGLVLVLWMLLTGRLLTTRGAVIPGLSALGLSPTVVRRSWAALGQGAWTADQMLANWQGWVVREGAWQPHVVGGYSPVAGDTTGFWRPHLQGCPTQHYSAAAGKALPAIPLGLLARVGSAHGQRLGVPLALVRAPAGDPSPRAHDRALVQQAVAVLTPEDALVVDRAFGVALLQDANVPAWAARLPKHFTARRATPPPYRGRGRPPTRGALVRPLARRRQEKLLAATPPDTVTCWEEDGRVLRAEQWVDLVLPDAAPGAARFQVVAVHDPRYRTPLLVATPLPLAPRQVRELYRDRWPVEQLPLSAKQLLGAARQFVSAPETCQRLPELALVAGAVLSYLAATQEAVPTGFWDRRPRRTPGRLRRLLADAPFPWDYPWPTHLRPKAAVTAHLPKGWFGQRRPTAPPVAAVPAARAAEATAHVAA